MRKLQLKITPVRKKRPISFANRKTRDGNIRELFSPNLVGKYEIALLMKYFNPDVTKNIKKTLYDLIPNGFKIVYYERGSKISIFNRAWNPSRQNFEYTKIIKRVYLKNEHDLIMVKLALNEYIWSVMRIADRKPLETNSTEKQIHMEEKKRIIEQAMRFFTLNQP